MKPGLCQQAQNWAGRWQELKWQELKGQESKETLLWCSCHTQHPSQTLRRWSDAGNGPESWDDPECQEKPELFAGILGCIPLGFGKGFLMISSVEKLQNCRFISWKNWLNGFGSSCNCGDSPLAWIKHGKLCSLLVTTAMIPCVSHSVGF